MGDRIGVGLIGANPDKGWGSSVHIPVLQHLDGFQLAAVATTREESARKSAELFGASHHFADAAELIACEDVDLVSIAVKAPDHYRVARLALEVGKHVYCEWPLAANVREAEELAALAASRNVCALVGLQARGAPALMQARALVRDGFVGPLLGARLACALPGGGGRRSREGLYVIENRNGASTLAIQGGHAIDALRFCLGELSGLSAFVDNHFTEVEIIETGEHLAKDAPDQIVAIARVDNATPVTITIHGGVVAGHGISLQIFGEEGTIEVGRKGPLNFQMSELDLHARRRGQSTLEPLEPGEEYDPQIIPAEMRGRQPYPGVEVPRATLVNVANLYRQLEAGINGGDRCFPDFEIGLQLHNILDALVEASATGRRQCPASPETAPGGA